MKLRPCCSRVGEDACGEGDVEVKERLNLRKGDARDIQR